jgi:agmatine deiminase
MKPNFPLLSARGYRIPAEWEEQEAVLLSWPHNLDTWPGKFAPIPAVYGSLIGEIVDHQAVWLLVCDDAMEIEAKRLLTLAGVNHARVKFITMPTRDTWCRDFGPISLVKNENGQRVRLFTDWIFNGWGGKYYTQGYLEDDVVPSRLAKLFGVEVADIPIILEGGSIDTNGQGALITSESCLLNKNRNESFTLSMIEEVLRDALGVRQIIWVPKGIAGDDTDGHVDDTVRFVNADTVICMDEPDTSDENHLILKDVQQRLKGVFLQNGLPLKTVLLPMPDPVEFAGERLPASYANFLITNKKVLVPIYRCPKKDAEALAILQALFPTRKVVGIDATDLVLGLGAIHCISQNIPAL